MGINLEDYRYTRPPDYLGPDWYGYYDVAGQSRDSDIVERANFQTWVQDMEEHVDLYYDEDTSPLDIDDVFHVIRDHHWAVGWVETLRVHKDAPEEMLEQVRENLEYLRDQYPILDEDLVAEMKVQAEEDYLEYGGYRDIEEMYDLELMDEGDRDTLKAAVDDWLMNDVLRFEHRSSGPYLVGEEEIDATELNRYFSYKVHNPWDGSTLRYTTNAKALEAVIDIARQRFVEGDVVQLLDHNGTPAIRIYPRVGSWEIVKVMR